MPLPSVQGYLLGTRQPMNYVEPALKAYLSVSQEMRARHQQMMSDLDQGQQQFLRGREETRRGEAHEQDMIDAQVNRAHRIEDQSFQREQMEWDREMHPLQMEKMQLGLDAAKFDRDVRRPLQVRSARLQLEQQQFKLRSAAAAEALTAQKQNAFEADLGVFQRIAGGDIPSPEPSVIEASMGDAFHGEGGVSGLPVTGLEPGKVYWNHDLNQPFTITEAADGQPVAIGRGTISVSGNKPHRWSPVRSLAGRPASAVEAMAALDGVESPGNPDVLMAMDRARDANAHLDYLEQAYSDIPSTKGVLGRFRSLLERDPGYQLAKTQGHLESPIERKQREQARDSQLRWAFPSDEAFRGWVSSNPEMHQSFRGLPDDQVEPTLKRIESRLKEGGEKPASSVKWDRELLDAEKAVWAAQGAYDAKKATYQGLPEEDLKKILKNEEDAVNRAMGVLREIQIRAGGGASPATDPEIEAAKGYFLRDDAP